MIDRCAVVAGLLLGAVIATMIDDGIMAWKPIETAPAEDHPAAKAPDPSFSVGPVPYRQGAGIGLAGQF